MKRKNDKNDKSKNQHPGQGIFKTSAVISLFLFSLCLPVFSPLLRGESQKKWTWKYPPERVKVTDDFSYIYQQDPQSAITVIKLMSRGGKRSVPLSKRGTALLATRLTVEMPDSDKLRKLMHLGSTMMYTIEGDYTTVTVKTLSENLEDTLKIVAGVIKDPLYSGLRIHNIKRYMEHRQKRLDDSPNHIMMQTFIDAFFGHTEYGYGSSVYGSEESRDTIKKKDVQAFYDRYFSRDNIEIIVTSNIEKSELSGHIQKHFQGFNKTKPAAESLPAASGKIPGKKRYTIEKDKEQVLIALGILLPKMSKKNFTMGYMLENFLGKGIGCKLWPLREKKELAYSLTTSYTQMKDAGLLTVMLKTDPGKQEEAYKALNTLIAGVHKDGATGEDLEITRIRSASDFLRGNETKMRRAQTLAYFEAMGTGYGFIGGFLKELDNVTVEEFNQYIKNTLDQGKMVEVFIGPRQENPQAPPTTEAR